MAYNVYISCDRCGEGYSWVNMTVNYSSAVSFARSKGWRVGKKGWYCPDCKKKDMK